MQDAHLLLPNRGVDRIAHVRASLEQLETRLVDDRVCQFFGVDAVCSREATEVVAVEIYAELNFSDGDLRVLSVLEVYRFYVH